MSGSWVPEVGEREAGWRDRQGGTGLGRARRGLGALLLAVAAMGVASWAAYLPVLWCAVLAVAYAALLAGLRCYPAGERERLARMCILVIGGAGDSGAGRGAAGAVAVGGGLAVAAAAGHGGAGHRLSGSAADDLDCADLRSRRLAVLTTEVWGAPYEEGPPVKAGPRDASGSGSARGVRLAAETANGPKLETLPADANVGGGLPGCQSGLAGHPMRRRCASRAATGEAGGCGSESGLMRWIARVLAGC